MLRTVPSKAIELAAFDTIKAARWRYNERAPPGAPRVPDRAVATVAGAIAGVKGGQGEGEGGAANAGSLTHHWLAQQLLLS